MASVGDSIAGTEFGLNQEIYTVPGIITATKFNESLWKTDQETTTVPAPSGKFIWNGGNVSGHNIDMNPASVDYERFAPFLNLKLLD